ncbi:hypothetical protein R6L23_26270 [Streptomyces sp. SR27]|uniref:hypothetical protein n=1 Tax=Streptomyces sp. SR27 TaxID=3076630 RepID=UPI00295B3156|nr:hypothetical protein [Streptomyces sp. SR27]MDV9191673.1 hypothetical protein [Streptomyces sp. SR27]
MKRFVVVEASRFPDALHARCAEASFSVWLSPAGRVPSTSVVDEHLVVDVDACQDDSLLDCADVLQGSRTHSAAGALRRLADLTAAHPACGIAAVPLAGGSGGWALTGGRAGAGTGAGTGSRAGVRGSGGRAPAGGSDRAVVLVPHSLPRPYRGSADPSLLPSCVHAWLVAGRSLREWPYARDVPSG